MSSEESQESLTYDEVNSWRSDALKLYFRQRGGKVSRSKQELVARVFAASEMVLKISLSVVKLAINLCGIIIGVEYGIPKIGFPHHSFYKFIYQ